jgi:hypothetical protein
MSVLRVLIRSSGMRFMLISTLLAFLALIPIVLMEFGRSPDLSTGYEEQVRLKQVLQVHGGNVLSNL